MADGFYIPSAISMKMAAGFTVVGVPSHITCVRDRQTDRHRQTDRVSKWCFTPVNQGEEIETEKDGERKKRGEGETEEKRIQQWTEE